MTENEVIEWQKAFKKTYKGVPKDVDTACDIAIKALEEIQQYRAIGTVEECREAMERQRAKKPKHFHKKYGKRKWKRDISGEIDEFAWEGDYHSGVVCEVCGECICTMCDPDYDELDDCEIEKYTCPNCGKEVYGKHKHCENCGQAILWERDTD